MNKGKLLVDATCAPADIGYPTDLKIINEAREKAEEIIDTLHKPFKGHQKKPRTYCQRAHKDFYQPSNVVNCPVANSGRPSAGSWDICIAT